jgi:hypothetical protein
MSSTTITIFKPNGDALRTISNPLTWNVDATGALNVTTRTGAISNVYTTSLPFFIERTP